MRLPFGFELILSRKAYSPISENRGGWWPLVREPFAGAWQRNQEWTQESVLAHHAVYACISLIASDIGKLRPKLVQQDMNEIWRETQSPAFSPVLRKPNRYQNHIQFKEWWITSKLIRGNTYVLKERDDRNVVKALYILDPTRVKVLVADDGSVFYQLGDDNLSGLDEGVTVPASEIIHDRMNCLFHPLVGTSAIFASGTAAHMGLKIEEASAAFFGTGSNPSGILTTPKEINKDQAEMLAEKFNAGFRGPHSGRIAILGNDLKFQPLRMNAVDSQLIQQLQWSAETVASTFHVPKFKIGVGEQPTYQNGEILNQIYYSDCLQAHIESMELALDEGLGLTEPKDGGRMLGVELDLDGLLRMDSQSQIKTLSEGIKGGVYKPDEARRKVDLPPVPGGNAVYLQQQNYSLEALAKRDAKEDPFAKGDSSVPAPPMEPTEPESDDARSISLRARAFRLRVAA